MTLLEQIQGEGETSLNENLTYANTVKIISHFIMLLVYIHYISYTYSGISIYFYTNLAQINSGDFWEHNIYF